MSTATEASAATAASAGRAARDWGYRPHLDGLRTVAVYAVLLYHARVGRFEGGFVGVDAFFTLSGYLVTSVLLTEWDERGTIRLARFYARRVRRLLPAAAVLIVGTSLATLLVVAPADRAQFANDATASSLWFANWHFISEFSDYFAVDAVESPFIHFWSLAIEEQFYLVFPLVVIAAMRWGSRRVLVAAIAALAVASLALQLVLAPGDVNRAYLGTDTRVYQILVGSLLAMLLRSSPSIGSQYRSVARATAGVALVSFVLATTSSLAVSASHRGVLAAAIAVVLIAALELGDGGVAARVLAVAPMRYLGQISYGTYLWHWPVLVLARSVVDLTPFAATVIAAAVGTGLAALSAELVELPIRRSQRFDGGAPALIAVGVTLATVTGLGVAPALLHADHKPAVTARGAAAAPVGVAASGPVPDLDWEAIARDQPDVPICERPDGADCFLTERSGGGTILLVGDSHARMLIPPLVEVAETRDFGLALSFSPSCPWQRSLIAGEPGDRFNDQCRVQRERTFTELLAALDPVAAIVAGFPRSPVTGKGAHTERSDWADLPLDQLVATATEATVETFQEAGIPLLVVEPVPILPTSQVSCLSAADDVADCAMIPNPEGIEESVERRLAAESSGAVAVLDLDRLVCPNLPVCDPVVDGLVVRRDAHHVTPGFASTLAPTIGAALDDLLGS